MWFWAISLLVIQIARSDGLIVLPADGGWGLPVAAPEEVGLLSSQLQYIDDAVVTAISDGEVPGAVVMVARRGKIAYFKAFGDRALRPTPEPMTLDTIFDLASLTKV